MRLALFMAAACVALLCSGNYAMGHACWPTDLGIYSPYIQTPMDVIAGFLACAMCWGAATVCGWCACLCARDSYH